MCSCDVRGEHGELTYFYFTLCQESGERRVRGTSAHRAIEILYSRITVKGAGCRAEGEARGVRGETRRAALP